MIDLHTVLGPLMLTASITAETESTVDLLTGQGRRFRVHKARLRLEVEGGRVTVRPKE